MTAEESSETKNKPDSKVAMNRMKEQIEEIAHEEADKMIDEAKERADQIVAEAKKEAESIKKQLLNEAKSEAEKKKVREISRKKLNIKMDYLETRESMIDEIVVEAKSQLQQFTKTDEYKGFLANLVKSSAISIGGGDLVVELRKEDKSHFTADSLKGFAKEISDTTGVDTNLSVSDNNLNALGGIKVIRSDNNLFVDNTFEQRLERSSEETRVALLDVLS